MQTLSSKYSLAWLMTTINHCQRIFQHQPKKDRMPHNSFQPGSVQELLLQYCWRFQAQGMPELQHRCEANNPTTVRDLQAICCQDHHPSNQHMLERRETSSCQLWRVLLLAWFVVPHGNNQWSRMHGFLVNGWG